MSSCLVLASRRALGWIFGVLITLGVAGCGGGGAGGAGPEPLDQPSSQTGPAAPFPEYQISVSGFSDAAALVSPDGADVALTTYAGGAKANLRFTCRGCNLLITIGSARGLANQDIPFSFGSISRDSVLPVKLLDRASGARKTLHLHSLPADYPAHSAKSTGAQEPGDLYVATFVAFGGTSGAATSASFAQILRPDGSLRYYRRDQLFLDFKKTTLPDGSVRLSLYDGWKGQVRVMNESFDILALLPLPKLPGSDSQTYDVHDHILLSDASYALASLENKTVMDMPGRVGIPTKVAAFGFQFIRDGATAFSWQSSDHPELYACATAGNAYGAQTPQPYADYMHFNSMQIDTDGNYLFSMRHLDALLKVNSVDGSIMWILGGPCDQFGLTASQKFSHQHFARRLWDGRIGLFDNGNSNGKAPLRTRILALNLDEGSRRLATGDPARPGFAEFFPANSLLGLPQGLSSAMGSAQFFPSGKILVGWGLPASGGPSAGVTEFDAATGVPTFELSFDQSLPLVSYRAVKYR